MLGYNVDKLQLLNVVIYYIDLTWCKFHKTLLLERRMVNDLQVSGEVERINSFWLPKSQNAKNKIITGN